MERNWKLIILVVIFILSIGSDAYAYDIEEQVTYNLVEEVALEEAFIKLEKIANNEISFYFAADVNLDKKFRILAGRNTYKNILDLILQFNNLKRIRLAKQLFYIYPKSTEAKYETAQKITFEEQKIMNNKIDWDNYIAKPKIE